MKSTKKKIDKIKDENKDLDNILASFENEVIQDKDAINKIFEKKTITIDFEQMQKDCDEESKILIEQMIFYYLDKDLIDHPYIKEKIKVDSSVISKIKFQLKTSEFAATKLLEQLQNGESFYKNYEVLGGLQRSQMEINKYLVQVQLVFEKNYRDLMDDFNTKKISKLENGVSDNNQLIGMGGIGHKQLLAQLDINS